jgi:hypothetical protein
MRFYQYLFYRIYLWQTKRTFDPAPQFSAFILTSVVLLWNLLLLVEVISLCFRISTPLPKLSKAEGLLVAVGYFVPSYLLLLHRGRYKEFIKKFDNESPSQHHIRGIGIKFYIAGSFVLLVLGSVLLGFV